MKTETKIPNRQNWTFRKDGSDNILLDKDRLVYTHVMSMLNKTQRIFEYNNLPEELPQREIEKLTQIFAFSIWKKVDGKMYVFYGGLGGIPNAYYLPTIAIVNNPFLKYNEQLKIDDNCVVMWNDSLHLGLMPIHETYALLLAENEISLRVATIWARVPAIIEADDDTEKESAESFIGKVEKGELAVLGTDRFIEQAIGKDGRVHDFNNRSTSHIKELIEENQYLNAKWWNELGINAPFNMKRESINESEASMNEDGLLPLIDDMLENRRIAVEKINKMFDLNITVDLSSSWKKIRKEIELEEKKDEAEIEVVEESAKEEKPSEETPSEDDKPKEEE